jgi:lipopolysaccharide export system protein LptA
LTSQQGPVTITARELEFDYRNRQLTYRGDVTVSQGDLTLQSNSLQLKLDREIPEKVHEIIAEGHVRVTKGDRLATGGRAVFDQDARTVVLSDQATLREGANEVSGERVVVYLDEQRSVVEGGERRVRAVLFPRGSSPGAAEPHEKSKSEADGS